MTRLPSLLFLAALLAAVVVAILHTPAPDTAATPDPVAANPATAPTARTPGTDQDTARALVTTILARPLFSPDRRPARTTPGRATAAAAVPRVAGILIDGSRRSVIFAAPTEGAHPITLQEGNDINGFRIRSIEDNQVTILGADGPQILRPTFDPRPPPPRTIPSAPGLPDLSNLTSLPGLAPNLPPAPPQAR